MASSFEALSFLLVAWTRVPGPGSRSNSLPPSSSQMPPEARIWFATITRAPAVPKKVSLSAVSPISPQRITRPILWRQGAALTIGQNKGKINQNRGLDNDSRAEDHPLLYHRLGDRLLYSLWPGRWVDAVIDPGTHGAALHPPHLEVETRLSGSVPSTTFQAKKGHRIFGGSGSYYPRLQALQIGHRLQRPQHMGGLCP